MAVEALPVRLPVMLPVTLPVRLAVILPALKLPEASRLTKVDAVLPAVAALAASSALWMAAADELPTVATVGLGKLPDRSPPADPTGEAPDAQLSVPEPLVVSNCPLMPSLPGSVHTTDPGKLSGALNARLLVLSLLLKMSLLAAVPLPRIVALPCEITVAAVSAPVAAVPVVLIVVEPPMLDAPLITAADKVLLVRVSASSRVTTTPEVGKVAVELTPVPPLAAERVPEVIRSALSGGISAAVKDVPDLTRPFTS